MNLIQGYHWLGLWSLNVFKLAIIWVYRDDTPYTLKNILYIHPTFNIILDHRLSGYPRMLKEFFPFDSQLVVWLQELLE